VTYRASVGSQLNSTSSLAPLRLLVILTTLPVMSRRGVRVTVAILAAYLFGWLAGRLPAPDDPAEFWIGNVGGPYLLIGFVAGAWATRRPVASAVLGSVCAAAAVCGFYDVAMIGPGARFHDGPPPTPWWTAAGQAYGRWLRLLLWGNVPWLTIAVTVGFVAGYLGHRWAVRGGRVGASMVCAVLVLEPVVYATGLNTRLLPAGAYAHSTHNITIWAIEALAGVSASMIVWRWRPGPLGDSPGTVNGPGHEAKRRASS
jgi:hypothetical protein